MKYATASGRDSIPAILPVLLTASALSCMAIVWLERRQRRARGVKRPASRIPSAMPQTAIGAHAPVVVRRYEIALPDRAVTRDIVLRLMQLHLTELAPAALDNFERSPDSTDVFHVGDEYELTMLGPWNGDVRVARMTADSFTLVTLRGHPEIGHITFSVADDPTTPGSLRVRIESRARSRTKNAARGTPVQSEVWTAFLQRLAVLAGVSTRPDVSITTDAAPALAATP